MVISADFNLPDILWDSIDSASGVNELAFIETLHGHLLTPLNKKRTCGVSSDWKYVFSGVPQGSIISPILFHIHINHIGSELSHDTSLPLYQLMTRNAVELYEVKWTEIYSTRPIYLT